MTVSTASSRPSPVQSSSRRRPIPPSALVGSFTAMTRGRQGAAALHVDSQRAYASLALRHLYLAEVAGFLLVVRAFACRAACDGACKSTRGAFATTRRTHRGHPVWNSARLRAAVCHT